MPEVSQIEYKSTLYNIKDADAAAKLEELLSGGDFFKRMGNVIFPIASILIRYDTLDPTTIFGGTWIEIPEGALRVTNNNNEVQTLHGTDTTKITVDELPAHNHPFTQPTIQGKYGPIGSAGSNLFSFWGTQGNIDTSTFTAVGGKVGNSGGGADFSLMQRSIYVKAWVRTGLYEGWQN